MTPARAQLARTGGLAVALVFVLAGGLRLWQLGREGIWCDEGYTANMIREPFTGMVHSLVTRDDAPPLFYIIEKCTVALTGDSESGLRLLPALAGIVAVAWLLVRARYRADRALFWAAAFFAVATYALFHARQARSYGMLLLFMFVFIQSAQDLLLANRRRAGPLLALSGALLVLTHNIGILAIGTSVLLWPLKPRTGGAPLRSWLGWHLVPIGLWVAYMAASISQVTTHAAVNAWMGMFWERRSLALAPLLSLAAFLPGLLAGGQAQAPFAILGEGAGALRILSFGLALVCLIALIRPRRSPRPAAESSEPGGGTRALVMEVAFLLLPLILLAVASAVWRPTYVVARTDALAFPAGALLIGRALARLPRGVAAAAVGLWVIVALASLAPSYGLGAPERAKGSDRQVASQIADAGLRPGDFVIHTFLTSPTIDHYLRRAGRPHRRVWFPEIAALNPAGSYPTPPESLRVYEAQAHALRARMERELPADGSTWIFVLLTDEAVHRLGPTVGIDERVSANDVVYPLSLPLFCLAGETPQVVIARYRQDWVSGNRAVVRVPRAAWVPLETLPPVALEAPAAGPETGVPR
jgi:4-amino-4-deoxy-L-arabinose transferase-like glycosyltransferase